MRRRIPVFATTNSAVSDVCREQLLVYEWLIMSIKGANHPITDDFAQI